MKQILLTMTALFMLSANCIFAQVTIGDLKDPESFSILELEGGGTRGLRLPQLSTQERNDMQATFGAKATADAMGLQIFNIDTKCVETWNGVEWIQACFTFSESVEDIEGNRYCAGDFGAAGIWMTENLRTTKYSNETTLTVGSAGYDYPDSKYYNYPNLDYAVFESHPEYGLLYSWAAASGLTGSGDGIELTPPAQKPTGAGDICPDGWHLPSDYEWNLLEKEIVTASLTTNKYGIENTTIQWADSWYDYQPYRGDHGYVMKSTTPVVSDNTPFTTDGKSNTPADNGFNALLVGIVESGSAYGYGSCSYFWSSSSDSYENTNLVWSRHVIEGDAGVTRYNDFSTFLLSVRCKKNE
ncbi:MAG: fibrobacter succinogenes major paralogous domain-containing protein [Dysgonamonadaceae bacterium]|jgi:uncharacterized protein (TIGR02145 family)|nr:fibrobacter succinogenes major paralogous domain-containing protein [Dysgonamonadaceae bacterium]